jgi:hypothetical protein
VLLDVLWQIAVSLPVLIRLVRQRSAPGTAGTAPCAPHPSSSARCAWSWATRETPTTSRSGCPPTALCNIPTCRGALDQRRSRPRRRAKVTAADTPGIHNPSATNSTGSSLTAAYHRCGFMTCGTAPPPTYATAAPT